MRKTATIFALLSYLSCSAANNNPLAISYISQYQSIAIEEMNRTGLPASISLARALLETAYGQNELATKANNHFATLCQDEQGFQTVHWGVERCFKSYQHPADSYREHSEQLKAQKQLFWLYDQQPEYTVWARALQKINIHQDPNYGDKLIAMVEKYQLQQLDEQKLIPEPAPSNSQPEDNISLLLAQSPTQWDSPQRTKPASFLFSKHQQGIFNQNGSRYVIAQRGESALAVSERTGISYHKLLKYNELRDGDLLMAYQYVYLEPKKSSYDSQPSYHKVEQDETIYEIAQFYGIRTEALLDRNGLRQGEEVAKGELVLLSERAVSRPKLRANEQNNQISPARIRDSALPKPLIVDEISPSPTQTRSTTYPAYIYQKVEHDDQTQPPF